MHHIRMEKSLGVFLSLISIKEFLKDELKVQKNVKQNLTYDGVKIATNVED